MNWWPRAGLLTAWALLAAQAVPANWRTPLEIDEQITHYLAVGTTPPTVWRRCQEQSATPPLHFWLVRASLAWSPGPLEFRLRLPGLLATALGLAFAWRIGERFLGRGFGAAAALLLACNPLVVRQFAEQSRPYALGFLLTLAGLDAALRLRSSGWGRRHFAAFVFCCAALPWTHYLFAPTIPALILAGWIARDPGRAPENGESQRCPRRWFLVAAGGAAAVGATPLLPGALRVQALSNALRWHTERPTLIDWLDKLGMPSFAALALAAVAAAAFWKRPRAGRICLSLSAAVLPAVALRFAAVALLSPALASVRYASPVVGPVALLIVASLRAAFPRPLAMLVAGLVGMLACLARPSLGERLGNPVWHDAEWRNAATLIAGTAGPQDVAFCQTGLVESRLVPLRFGDPGFQEYCASRLGQAYLPGLLPRFALPETWTVGPDGWKAIYSARASGALVNGGTVWLVVSADTDPGKALEAAAVEWLRALGAEPKLLRGNPIARVWAAGPRGGQ